MADDKIIFEIRATAKGVKVVQKQTDDLAKSTERADKSTKKLDKSRDAYNRREKGAANISSNQTKNFSKMQQGIDGGGGSGGLVRAYALLAANVFALTAAFGVLSRSAQIDTLTQSMEILSTTGGTYIKNLAKDMQEASGFAIDLAQAFSQVSLASSAGLSTKEIEGLTKVAKGAAISLGRNLPDAMDRIFRGAIKLEPEILDEIGLFVRVDEAAQKYARNNNKVVSSLTQVEKRQAFLNEILDQGLKKFEEYAEGIKPDPYVRLGAALGDIAQGGLSLVNTVFGPLLSFLAESRTILTAVFGVLVFSLIKKAIPALGQFNMNLAENAREAADNAREYTAGVKATTTAQVQADNEKLQSTKDRLEGERKLTGKMKGRAGQGKEAVATRKALKTEMNAEKRLGHLRDRELQINKQIHGSGKAQQKLLKEDLKLLKKELKNLEQQEKLTKKIADNTLKGQIDPKKGSVTDRRQEKLDVRANRSMIVADASGVAESQGVMAGFKEMNKGLEKNDKNLGRFGKAAVRAKGSISILGTGLSRVMMMLGPWMMAFSMLSPILIAFGKHLGFGNEQSKALGNTIDKVSDQTEKLAERFKVQVESSRDVELSFREQNKAVIAYNKGQIETSQNILQLSEDLVAFKDELGFVTGLWEFFKSGFNMSKEQKTVSQQIKSITNSIDAALDKGDKSKLNQYLGLDADGNDTGAALPGAKEYIDAVKNVTSAEKAAADASEGISEERMAAIQKTIHESTTAARIDARTGLFVGNVRTKLTEADKKYAQGLLRLKNAKDGVVEADKNITRDQTKIAANAVEQIKFDKQRVETYMAMESALEGASEGISKFQQSFSQTTKVDDVLSSFQQLTGALEGLDTMADGERTKFFADFDKADNPFNKIFMDTEKTQEAFEARIVEITEDLNTFREDTITAASKIKVLQQEIKQFNSIFKSGLVEATVITKKQTSVLTNQLKIERANTSALLISKGIKKETAIATMESLKNATTETEQQEILNGLNLDSVSIDQISAQLDNEAAKALEEKVSKATEVERAKIMELKLSQEILGAEKQLAEAQTVAADQEAKLARLRATGSTDLDPAAQAKLEIDAAKSRMDMTIREAEIKHSLLAMEKELLKARIIAIDAELRSKDKDGLDVEGLSKALDDNELFSGNALQQQIENARSKFQLDMAATVKTAYGSSMLAGIQASQAQFDSIVAAQAERRAKIVLAAEEKAKADGIVGEGIVKAGEAAGTDFDNEKDDKGNNKRKGEKDAARMQQLRATTEGLAEKLKELGPEGAAISAVITGALTMSDAYATFGDSAGTAADKAAFAATAISAISSMMAAQSKAQIAEVDKQIEAEKKRDGKSSESVNKIKALEKKKEAMERKAFERNKKMQMAQAIASTAAGIAGVLSGIKDPIVTAPMAFATAVMIGAMGAAQLAIISKQKYSGGSGGVEKPSMGA